MHLEAFGPMPFSLGEEAGGGRMGEGYPAPGPLSWMRSEARVQGSPMGVRPRPSQTGSGRDGEVGFSEGMEGGVGPRDR